MIDRIELAILERLRTAGATGILPYRFETLETYPEEWDAYLEEKGPIKAPAAWATWAGWRPIAGENLGLNRVTLTFGLVVMAENARPNETFRRHGGPDVSKETGSYRLLVDAAKLLAGQDLGLDMTALRLGSAHQVLRLDAVKKRKVSMLALMLETDVAFTSISTDPDDAVGDFGTFHANWDIPAFGGMDADPGEPGNQIPADDKADATDHVQMETSE